MGGKECKNANSKEIPTGIMIMMIIGDWWEETGNRMGTQQRSVDICGREKGGEKKTEQTWGAKNHNTKE